MVDRDREWVESSRLRDGVLGSGTSRAVGVFDLVTTPDVVAVDLNLDSADNAALYFFCAGPGVGGGALTGVWVRAMLSVEDAWLKGRLLGVKGT